MTSSIRVVRDRREAGTLLHPVRLRILEHLAEPDSATGVSRRLRLPRQRVNYHLRLLESRGLLRLVGERRVGNCTERMLQTTADRIVLSPRILGRIAADRAPLPEDGAGRLLAAAARVEREVGGISDEAPAPEVHVVDRDVRLADPGALLAEIEAVLARWAEAAPPGTGGPTHRLIVAIHRRPTLQASLPDPRVPADSGP